MSPRDLVYTEDLPTLVAATAKPFQWTFTRMDLADLLAKLKPRSWAAPPDPKIRPRNCETQH